MRARSIRTAVVAGAAAALLAACGGSGSDAPSSSLAPPASTSAAPTQPSASEPASSPTPSQTSQPPSLGPTIDTGTLAAFQLCGTSLALAAGFVGQVAPEQLAEGKAAVAAARAEYVDDGSGLLQLVDELVAAVEDADSATVITTAQKLGDVCKSFDPGS